MNFRRLIFILSFIPVCVIAQPANQTLAEIKKGLELEWKSISKWADSAKNTVEILPADSLRSIEAFRQSSVLRQSILSAIVLNTGGILVDNGWIRIMASGHECLDRALLLWNKYPFDDRELPGYTVIGDDAIGGYFLLNSGGLGTDPGNIYYFSPASLEYEPMGLNYAGFLQFCFNGDLNKFYKGYRWKSWQDD
ncbi:MAG: DUF2625 family protein, partial [Chitinophagaceae bacterium]